MHEGTTRKGDNISVVREWLNTKPETTVKKKRQGGLGHCIILERRRGSQCPAWQEVVMRRWFMPLDWGKCDCEVSVNHPGSDYLVNPSLLFRDRTLEGAEVNYHSI